MGLNLLRAAAIAACILAAGGPAFAASSKGAAPRPSPPVKPPYEHNLLRLAEILGSLQFLRNLCGEPGAQWRDQMNTLLATENPNADDRSELMASYNHGYRSYSDTYAKCTPSALAAIARYMKEGAKLARQTAIRYGN